MQQHYKNVESAEATRSLIQRFSDNTPKMGKSTLVSKSMVDSPPGLNATSAISVDESFSAKNVEQLKEMRRRHANPTKSMNQMQMSVPGLNVEIINNFLPGNDSKN